MAEIIITAAPDHNDHHGHGYGQSHRRKIKHVYDFADISHQHDDRQSGNAQDRPILTVDLPVRALTDSPDQCAYTKNIGNNNTAEQKKHIQRAVSDADMVKPIRIRHPLDIPVKKTVPVKKHGWQNKKAHCGQKP